MLGSFAAIAAAGVFKMAWAINEKEEEVELIIFAWAALSKFILGLFQLLLAEGKDLVLQQL